MGGRLEAAHLPLALTGLLMLDFRAVVGALVRAVDYRRHRGADGRELWNRCHLDNCPPEAIIGVALHDLRLWPRPGFSCDPAPTGN